LARFMNAFRDGKVITKQRKWHAKVWKSIGKAIPKHEIQWGSYPNGCYFWINWEGFSCFEVIFHAFRGTLCRVKMNSRWLLLWFGNFFMLRELCGSSAGTLRELPRELSGNSKGQNPRFAQGFEVFGEVLACVPWWKSYHKATKIACRSLDKHQRSNPNTWNPMERLSRKLLCFG